MNRMENGNGKLSKCNCPVCHRGLNMEQYLSAAKPPQPGDAYVCVNCASVLVFNKELNLQEPTLGEMVKWSDALNCAIEKTQLTIRRMNPET